MSRSLVAVLIAAAVGLAVGLACSQGTNKKAIKEPCTRNLDCAYGLECVDETGAPVAAAGEDAGVRPAVSGPAGAGALYACLDPGTSDADAARFVTMLRERVAGALGSGGPRGGVAVLTAPPAVLAAGTDGAVPGLALMRAVKNQFDPDHRMFPGRLEGGR